MIDPASIIREIQAGLANESGRMDAARENLDYYRGEFDGYWDFGDRADYEPPRHKRTVLLAQMILLALTRHLYSKGPAREIAGQKPLTDWLAEQYQREGVDGLLQEVDRLALAARACCVQVTGPDDSEDAVEAAARPVRYQVWPADSFAVWGRPDDPTRPAAVATIDRFDEQKRLRLWTADTRYTFVTSKLGPGQTAGGQAYTLVAEDENYYGCLPFAFFHCNPPTIDFWNHGPGDLLTGANRYFNHHWTDLGDSLGYAIKPVVTEYGNDSQPPRPLRPGSIWRLNPSLVEEGGSAIPPEVGHLQPDLGYVEASWADSKAMMQAVLDSVGCPESAVRLSTESADSGFKVLVEQQPLVTWATGRQRAFLRYERSLARATIAVGAKELDRLRSAAPAKLDPIQADRLALRWPSMQPEVPMTGAEQTAQDASDLASGFTTLVKVVQRRLSCTRDEAMAYLKSNQDDEADLIRLGVKQPPPQAAQVAATEEEQEDARAEAE